MFVSKSLPNAVFDIDSFEKNNTFFIRSVIALVRFLVDKGVYKKKMPRN